jgi:hypothetical protein
MGIPILAQLFLWDGTTFPRYKLMAVGMVALGIIIPDTIYGFSHTHLNGTGV